MTGYPNENECHGVRFLDVPSGQERTRFQEIKVYQFVKVKAQ